MKVKITSVCVVMITSMSLLLNCEGNLMGETPFGDYR